MQHPRLWRYTRGERARSVKGQGSIVALVNAASRRQHKDGSGRKLLPLLRPTALNLGTTWLSILQFYNRVFLPVFVDKEPAYLFG